MKPGALVTFQAPDPRRGGVLVVRCGRLVESLDARTLLIMRAGTVALLDAADVLPPWAENADTAADPLFSRDPIPQQ